MAQTFEEQYEQLVKKQLSQIMQSFLQAEQTAKQQLQSKQSGTGQMAGEHDGAKSAMKARAPEDGSTAVGPAGAGSGQGQGSGTGRPLPS